MAAITSNKHFSEATEAFSPCKAIKRAKNDVAARCVKVDRENVIVQVWSEISVYLIPREQCNLQLVSKSWKMVVARCMPLNYLKFSQPFLNVFARTRLRGDAESRQKAEMSEAMLTSFLEQHGMTKPKPRAVLADITALSQNAAQASRPFVAPSTQEGHQLNQDTMAVWKMTTQAEARTALEVSEDATDEELVSLECKLLLAKQWYSSVVSTSQISKILDKNTAAADSIIRADCLDEESLDWIGSTDDEASSSPTTAAQNG